MHSSHQNHLQTYILEIDHNQLKAITEALAKFPPIITQQQEEEDYLSFFGVSELLNMLLDLPNQEEKNPEAIHGLCR